MPTRRAPPGPSIACALTHRGAALRQLHAADLRRHERHGDVDQDFPGERRSDLLERRKLRGIGHRQHDDVPALGRGEIVGAFRTFDADAGIDRRRRPAARARASASRSRYGGRRWPSGAPGRCPPCRCRRARRSSIWVAAAWRSTRRRPRASGRRAGRRAAPMPRPDTTPRGVRPARLYRVWCAGAACGRAKRSAHPSVPARTPGRARCRRRARCFRSSRCRRDRWRRRRGMRRRRRAQASPRTPGCSGSADAAPAAKPRASAPSRGRSGPCGRGPSDKAALPCARTAAARIR